MNAPTDEESIFLAALEKSPSRERAVFVEGACLGNAELLERVRQLIASHEESHGPLDAPPSGIDATRNMPPISEGPGTQIGPYKLREQIGEGGFGMVYVAEQEKPVRRKVALKVIKPGMDTKDVIARFEAERQALAVMDHPNVARVLDAGATETGRPYFVMELVHGVAITEFCDRNNFTARQRLELFVDVCRAVQHAHQKGIIHRDLKPNNIMVTLHDGRPVPKVIDFGVSKALSQRLTEKTVYTRYGQMIGTPVYMSPEQAEMSGLGVDTRSDIYSLGVLLYELLTGKTPIDSERLRASGYAEMLRIIREEEPPRPSLRISTLGKEATSITEHRRTDVRKLGQSLRGELDWIVMKALDKDRDLRYETANQFAADVEHYLHEEPVQACPPSTVYRFKKFARRNKRLIATAAAIVTVLLAATLVSVSYAMSERQARLDQDRYRQDAEFERDRALRSEQLAQDRLEQVEAEKKRVEQQRAAAQAVHHFVRHEMSGRDEIAARPRGRRGLESGPDFPDLLDRASRGLEDRFRDEPLSEAAVRMALGENYRLLRQNEQAREHMQRSVALWTDALGPDDPNTLDGKWQLASLYHDETDYEHAEPLLVEVLKAYTDQKGAGDSNTLSCMNSLALLYHDLQQYERAEPMYRAALEHAEANLSGDDELTLVIKSNLATLCRDQQQYDETQSMYEQVYESRLARLVPEHQKTRLTAEELASVYRGQGAPEAADQLMESLPEARSTVPFRGPIHATFADLKDLVIITPTNESSQADGEKIDAHVTFVKEHFLAQQEMPPRVLTDKVALESDLSNSTLMVYGTPMGNLWLAEHVPQLADQFATARRLAHQDESTADDLRFITAWPNPANPRKGAVIYTALRAENIANINAVFHGPYDYVLARGEYNLRTGNYRKHGSQWSLLPAGSK